MKKLLLIIGFVLAISLFFTDEESYGEDKTVTQREAVMKEKDDRADMQHRIETISKDLRGNSFLTPRRHIQSTYYTPHVRVIRSAERVMQDIRLRGMEQQQRLTEYISIRQTLKYSALLHRLGYHIYALRKIII